MAKILSIETAAKVCSVAVHEDGSLLGLSELHLDNIHGRKLIPVVKELLGSLGLTGIELDAVAVSKGPGSYTGLRIGVSTAKGLAYAWDLPLIGVDTLDALARNVRGFGIEGNLVIPVLDARRMEVYAKVLDSEGKELEGVTSVVVDQASFFGYANEETVYIIGDAVPKLRGVLVHPNMRLIAQFNSAKTVGEIAFESYQLGVFEDLAYFEPNYLKEFRVISSKKGLLHT
ncbi:MAG: tRNA (adenosine(37)-N6)-threonylcarbamoyltransferase complex dimerization subunit type 1 TsaB [Lunatimonas sp.]|uniref:tRNA (adenosine(37)-N6)-threonylcarbamoyltransferase complex dimerization subunit type 1 TsaB n=1 Tax=Lunatimonas sp. TaxID=2060141 RepID=UPI00263B875B|nr:tRNA (adenosine(37)-N6)-threonylcarbamoyltransferase complex dimerization subunit type 1 TsaB [Lunatimonas sp.]MCC5937237.1 tRNA (adenosine(37)-N6)-threonylcarbamoyltransferase complex dimerization subunit type 1 TsaB [Lunatimonas sp.]